MTLPEFIFWGCAACVAYTYAGYPLLLALVARFRPRPVHRAPYRGTVTIVVAAFNEAQRIAARRDELATMLTAHGLTGEVIIVSDGSTDGTADAARQGAATGVRVIELVENVGKAEALNRGCALAVGDVIVFADARQRWAPDALCNLLENFSDETVGGASGDLCLETSAGVNAGVGLYWKYEKRVRTMEGRIHSTVGATGAISAVRRRLFHPIPRRTILDDVYWPMQVVLQGSRVIHDGRAKAYDRLPEKPKDELRRKIRTLTGNFQLLTHLPQALLPGLNPIWLQFVSHKLLRLAVPWLLIGVAVYSVLLFHQGVQYHLAVAAQALGYLLGLAGLSARFASRSRIVSAASSFLLLNAAAWMAFWVWLGRRSASSWRKVAYVHAPEDARTSELVRGHLQAARLQPRRPAPTDATT